MARPLGSSALTLHPSNHPLLYLIFLQAIPIFGPRLPGVRRLFDDSCVMRAEGTIWLIFLSSSASPVAVCHGIVGVYSGHLPICTLVQSAPQLA